MKPHQLRSTLGLSSLALLALAQSTFAASRITVQPQHVIAAFGSEVIQQIGVEQGYPHATAYFGITAKCCCRHINMCPRKVMDGDASWQPAIHSSEAGPFWFEITGANGKEKSNVAQITVVDTSPNMAVDRGVGGKVSFTARCWNPPKIAAPSSAFQWYDSLNNIIEDGVNGDLGTVSGARTAVLTISGLKQTTKSFYCKVKGYGPESLNTAAYTVNVLPTAPKVPAAAIGNYIGIIDPGPMNSNAGGRLDLNITATSMTANLKLAGLPAFPMTSGPPSVNGNVISVIMSNRTISPALIVTCQIDTTNNRIKSGAMITHGVLTSPFRGWKNTPALLAVQGRYNFAFSMTNTDPVLLPRGRSWGTFTVAANGTYKMVGRTACNETFTCSAFVGPDAHSDNVAMYAVHPSGSTFSGLCLLNANNGLPNYLNKSSIIWRRPTTLTAIYPNGFNESVDIDGGKYLPTTTLMNSYITASGGTADLSFTGTGLPARYNPDRPIGLSDFTVSGSKNIVAAKALYGQAMTSLSIATSTGLLNSTSSKFTLLDNIPGLIQASVTRKVNFSGIAFPTPNVPGGMSIEGYFMLPQLVNSLGQAPVIKSGLVLVR